MEGDIDQQIESMLAPKRIVKEIKAPLGTLNPTTGATQGTLILYFMFLLAFHSIKRKVPQSQFRGQLEPQRTFSLVEDILSACKKLFSTTNL